MNSPTHPAAIVVGVDAQGSAADAVCWAAAEAAAQHRPLHVVHAFRQPTLTASYGVPGAEVGFCWARVTAEQVLGEAVALARSIAPDTKMTALLHFGAAAQALLREASSARLLVLGNRRLSGVRRLLSGSLSIRVSRRARCPTVVIHTLPGVGAGASTPRVVVGVDSTPYCAPAIGFAFQAARQRGIPLTALHACSSDAPVDFAPIRRDSGLAEYLGLLAVERALKWWRSQYTNVPVMVKLVHSDPARALIAEAAGAALVVVGSRGRGHLNGLSRASTSYTVLRNADSPIAVVSYRSCFPEKCPRPSPFARERHRPTRRRKQS